METRVRNLLGLPRKCLFTDVVTASRCAAESMASVGPIEVLSDMRAPSDQGISRNPTSLKMAFRVFRGRGRRRGPSANRTSGATKASGSPLVSSRAAEMECTAGSEGPRSCSSQQSLSPSQAIETLDSPDSCSIRRAPDAGEVRQGSGSATGVIKRSPWRAIGRSFPVPRRSSVLHVHHDSDLE